MNERIKELWSQSKTSGVHPNFGEYDKYSADKFAQLIVRECVSIMEWQKISPKNDGAYNSALSLAQRNIKEQFGVEE
jgi:hypothetical protein